VFFDGRCFTHHGERHSFAIDAEIACLERAKALLSASGTVVARRKPGRAAKVAIAVAPKVQKARKRRRISAEGRERPAGADQAMGCLKERIQSEHERYRCATAQGEEEGRNGCLM